MTFTVNWDSLKRKDGTGAVSGERVELALGNKVLRFVLAGYDSKIDVWMLAAANEEAHDSGFLHLAGESLHTHAIRLDREEVERARMREAMREIQELQANPEHQEAVRKLFS